MSKPEAQSYKRLLEEIEAESESQMLDSLLTSVTRRKRTRLVKRCSSLAAILCLAALSVKFLHETPSEPRHDADFTEIKLPGSWSTVEPIASFHEISDSDEQNFEFVETERFSPVLAIDESDLIRTFEGRPTMITQSEGTRSKQFWLLDDLTL